MISTPVLNILDQLYFSDLNTGTVVGNNNTILRTINGGVNWELQTSTPSDRFNSIFFLNSNTGFICASSSIRKTINGGTNWLQITNVGGYDIIFTDTSTGYACGVAGRIRKTTDGGFNWVNQVINVSGFLNGLSFVNNTNGFVVGGDGDITRTTDGGLNWIAQIRTTLNVLSDVFITNLNTAYIVGDFGTILKTTNGGLVFIKANNNTIPSNSSLFQNFPNPFNSSTVIKYQIKNSSNVNLKLYNLEGKEISVLVKEKQNPGLYEVLFDSQGMSSGIYFYSIFINVVLINTKKLILIK
ncbi:MAG: YCF48-related protein [Ignavibacteria bacterium]